MKGQMWGGGEEFFMDKRFQGPFRDGFSFMCVCLRYKGANVGGGGEERYVMNS